eukprot:COSAG06_NODE_10629_length_1646_cov_0.812540_3_plen_55_part_00
MMNAAESTDGLLPLLLLPPRKVKLPLLWRISEFSEKGFAITNKALKYATLVPRS